MDKLLEILQAVGIPFAYDHFAEGESPEPPFHLLSATRHRTTFPLTVEPITRSTKSILNCTPTSKDLDRWSRQLEAVLDEHGIFYDKTETWIESEKLYEVLYSFEMEA